MSNEERYNVNCCTMFKLFCCPPCPQKITEKFIFAPPSPPGYELQLMDEVNDQYVFLLSPNSDSSGLRDIVKQDSRFIKTRLQNNIAVLYIRCISEKNFTIIYSHGNAVDLGQMHKICTELSLVTSCDIVCYDYSGYGRSEGKPSEKNLYADIKAVWDYTLTFHEPNPKKIILFGQSLGSAPTLHLASEVYCAGVILQSPFLSSLRVACPKGYSKFIFCLDRFKK